jgi:hypothetical protein
LLLTNLVNKTSNDPKATISINELGYTTLSVAESRRDVSVGASSCIARSVTEDNVPLGRARAEVPSVACQPQLYAVARNTNLDSIITLLTNSSSSFSNNSIAFSKFFEPIS